MSIIAISLNVLSIKFIFKTNLDNTKTCFAFNYRHSISKI